MISLTPMIIMSSYREFIEAEKSRKVERSVKKPNSEIARSASTFLIRGGIGANTLLCLFAGLANSMCILPGV